MQKGRRIRIGIGRVACGLGCAFLLAPLAQAQSWFPTGTTWTYDLASIYYLGYVEHEVTGDTVVDGLTCRLIQVTEHYTWLWDGQEDFTMARDPVVVHEADDLVLIHTEAGFDTLFDLDAAIGDRWMLAWASEPCDTSAWAEVMGAGNRTIGGESLKWLALDLHFPGSGGAIVRDTVVERLGSLYTAFAPQGLCMGQLDASVSTTLRCFDDGAISYMADGLEACDINLSVERISGMAGTLQVFPVPATDFIHLAGGRLPTVETLTFHDAMGRLAGTISLRGGQEPIDISWLAPGMYTLRATTHDGEQQVARLVKQ